MKCMDLVEGEFVCTHLAPNAADLVLVLTDKKKHYKTTVTRIDTGHHHTVLFTFRSCKKCFDGMTDAAHAGQARNDPMHTPWYNVRRSFRSHHKVSQIPTIMVEPAGLRLLRDAVGFPALSGYEFDGKKARALLDQAVARAYYEYYMDEEPCSYEEWVLWLIAP